MITTPSKVVNSNWLELKVMALMTFFKVSKRF